MPEPHDRVSEEANITRREVENIEERARLRARVVYEIIRVEGEEEMERPIASLWWSGLAAGVSLSFSLLAEALLKLRLPHAGWSELVADFGYCVGFLMVILGRQQLFTESTITVVLPVFADFNVRNLARLFRMWGVVLVANIAGTIIAAAFWTLIPALSDEIRSMMIEISAQALSHGWWTILCRGVLAGFLMAALVWMIPSAKGSESIAIIAMTYLIAAGGFSHVVAGNMEAFMLVWSGQRGLADAIFGFTTPALLGNVIGGTALFALISYAQVMREM